MSFRQFAMCIRFCIFAVGVCRPVAAHAIGGETAENTAAGLAFFETRIRPVLVEKCYSCHSSQAEELQAGLFLDSREGLLRGGDSGPAVVAGRPRESLLIQALNYEAYEMPPSGKLPATVVADFERWIEIGMPDPRTSLAAAQRSTVDLDEGRRFWSFQLIKPSDPPPVNDIDGPLGRIDRSLLAKLEKRALKPAPDADRAAWLRRVTFDLIGLPPTIQQIDEFLSDTSPEAIARVVDRLLASPHFGERWGRHWLDVARFAESSGGGRTLVFKDAWRYRDYVINSVNRDKPLESLHRGANCRRPAAAFDRGRGERSSCCHGVSFARRTQL